MATTDYAQGYEAEESTGGSIPGPGTLLERSRSGSTEAKTAWFHALDFYTKLTAAHPGATSASPAMVRLRQRSGLASGEHDRPGRQDPACALSLALKTTEAYPECAAPTGIPWGLAYYRTGDFKAANTALDRSITLGEEVRPSTISS